MGFLDSIKESLDEFVFSLTTNDRYASSRTTYNVNNINSNQNSYQRANTFDNNVNSQGNSIQSPELGYRPGMKSRTTNDGIQMRDYASSIPTPELWERIEKILYEEFPDLVDFLNEPATAADLNELENDINVTLPLDVRESWQIHDGQERGGKPSGVIMGLTILDIESIAEEYTVWQTANKKIEYEQNLYREKLAAYKKQMEQLNNPSSSSENRKVSGRKIQPPVPRIDFMSHQRSYPEGSIQPVYVHSGWVPLVKDFSGNNIAVDLAPGPKGKWGQIICFGNDFDTKFVIANSWSEFLESVVKDFEAGNFNVDIDYDELSYCENGVSLNYFDALKTRHLPKFQKRMNYRGPIPPNQYPPQQRHYNQKPQPVQFPSTSIGGSGNDKKDVNKDLDSVDISKETLIVPEGDISVKTETEKVAEDAELKFDESEAILSIDEKEEIEDENNEKKPLNKAPEPKSSDFI